MRKELSWIGASPFWAPAGRAARRTARRTAAASGRKIFIVRRLNFGYPKPYLQRAGLSSWSPILPLPSFPRCRAAAPHLPYPSSPQGRGGRKKEARLVFLPSLLRGERGRGSEGRRRGD